MTSRIQKFVNTVITGDCSKVLKKIPDSSVHLSITSPPYNLGIEYDGYSDNKSYAKYLDWMTGIGHQLHRVLVTGGRFALNVAPTGINPFKDIHHDLVSRMKQVGFIFRTEILWYKQTMKKRTSWGSWKSPSNPHIIPSWEYIYVFSKDTWKLPGRKEDIDITSEEFKTFSDGFWKIQPETRNRQPFLKGLQEGKHPSPFPEKLIYRLVKLYSYRGNIILDPFGGTGTVAVVASKNGRQYIHIDQSSLYNNITSSRLEKVSIENVAQDLLFPKLT